MLNLNRFIEELVIAIHAKSPWTNVFGLSRSLLAMGTFLTILVNPPEILFTKILVADSMLGRVPFHKFSFFEILHTFPELSRMLAIFILFIVVIGWRPKLTCILHFWITISFMLSTETPDGGDQISSLLALLFVFIGIFDSRKWHWDSPIANTSFYSRAFAHSVLIMVKIQVSIIYLHAAIGKLQVNEWVNGTAVWYWLQDPIFGANSWMSILINPIIGSNYGVVILTWGTIILELLLASALVMSGKNKRALLVFGLIFHFSILLVQGLGSFFFAMASALVIYLRSPDDLFAFSFLRKEEPKTQELPQLKYTKY